MIQSKYVMCTHDRFMCDSLVISSSFQDGRPVDMVFNPLGFTFEDINWLSKPWSNEK